MKHEAGSGALSRVRKYFPGVSSVEDATRALTIEVTRGDEARATRKAHKDCALAVACKRSKGLDGVIVSVKTAYLIKGTKAIRYNLPERVSREIISFDRGSRFEPGVYQLITPEYKLGEHANGSQGHGKDRSNKGTTHVKTTGIRTVLGSQVE